MNEAETRAVHRLDRGNESPRSEAKEGDRAERLPAPDSADSIEPAVRMPVVGSLRAKMEAGGPLLRGATGRRCWLRSAVCASTVLLASCGGFSRSLRHLEQGSEPERLRAVAEIASSGAATTEVLGALSRALEDPSVEVRWGAAGALGRLGPRAAGALPALLGCIERQQEALAFRCAQVAAGVGPGALPGLRRLLASPDARVRRGGVRALAALGVAAAPAVDELIPLLVDADPGISAGAVEALAAIGPPAVLPLVRASSRGRRFGKPASKEGAAAQAALDAMKPYPVAVLLDLLPRGQEITYWAAEQIRLQRLEVEAVPVLVRLVEQGGPGMRAFAARQLGDYGSKAAAAVPELAKMIGTFDDQGIRAALAGIGEASLPVVEELLRSPVKLTRIKGIRILAQMRPLPVQRLTELAHGEDPELRGLAWGTLAEADTQDIEALRQLAGDSDWRVREGAIRGLERIRPWNEKVGDALSRMLLHDPDPRVRLRATMAFRDMGVRAAPAAAALTQALSDQDKSVRSGAREALTRIGTDALPAVLEGFRTGDAGTRESLLAVVSAWRTAGLVTDVIERELRLALVKDEGRPPADAAFALLVAGRFGPEEVAIAAQALRSQDQATVLAALSALRTAGVAASEALPVLLSLAPGVDGKRAGEYLETLRSVGRRDPRLIPIYVDFLRRGQGARQAREGLEWFDDDAIAPLVALLGEEGMKGGTELEKALLERGAPVVPALEAALSGENGAQRLRAAQLLCRFEKIPPQAVPVLLEALRQDDRKALQNALYCLAKPGVALAPHADFFAQRYERLDGDGKAGVLTLLGFCGEAARPHLRLLLAAVSGPAQPGARETPRSPWDRETLRLAAMEALGRLGGVAREAVPVLARWAVEPIGMSDRTQRAAVAALGGIGPDARPAVPMLLPLLDSPEELYQAETLQALTAIGAPREILAPRCLVFLRTGGRELGLRALEYLMGVGYDAPEFTGLLEMLARGGELRYEAARALRQRRPPSGGAPLEAPVLGVHQEGWGVQVRWGEVPGASGYRLFRREEPYGEWSLSAEAGWTSFADHGVEPGRVYAYRVEAFNADVDGRPSAPGTVEVTGTVIREQHSPPGGLEVVTAIIRQGDQDVRQARLSWHPPREWDCRGYVIFRGLTGSNAFGPIGVSSSTFFVDEKPHPDYSTSYFVRGIDADYRQSEASNEVTVGPIRPRR